MIWVSWRQHRSQAIACLGLFCALAIFAIAAGAWMRTTFSDDGLAGCLARSGGVGCPAAITSFVHRFNGGAAITVIAALFAIPGLVGVVVGAPLLGRELEQGTWRLAWSQTVPRTRWLVAKLALVSSGLVVFGAAITAVMTWYRQPLDRLTTRLQPPPFNFEGQLHLGWQQWLYDVDDPNNEADGPAEMFSAMITFDLLAMELAGKTRPRTALDHVTNAAELPDPRFPAPAGPRLVQIVPAGDWAEEDSPAVQLMRKFEEVARLAARQYNTGLLCDPDQFYSIAFG